MTTSWKYPHCVHLITYENYVEAITKCKNWCNTNNMMVNDWLCSDVEINENTKRVDLTFRFIDEHDAALFRLKFG
jgi:hypothetical protein